MFFDARLPTTIERGSRGGPNFFTSGVVSPSGNSQRNQHWQDDLPEWDISYGLARKSLVQPVVDFWFSMRGAAHSFRFRDWSDYVSGPFNVLSPTAQATRNANGDLILVGDGVVDNVGFAGHRAGTRDWQLCKIYGDMAVNPYFRPIFKPVLAGVIYYVNDVVTAVTHLADGVFRFANADIPLVADVVTAQFEYDNPVHFTSDKLAQELSGVDLKNLPAINLMGVRPPEY